MPLRSRRFLIPEVVQTSAMDCGPAAVKCILEGYGIHVSYGRLREACQTDLDGTSIDTLEEVLRRLGLDAEQLMEPLDHLLLDEARLLPALLVARLPNGVAHFLVVWRRIGRWVQVMDPAIGRRWLSGDRLLQEAFVHRMPVPASTWRAWAASADFLDPLRRRLRDLNVGRLAARRVDAALDDPDVRALARLDAATRFTEALARAGAVRRGRPARRLLLRLCETGGGAGLRVPAAYWSAEPDGEQIRLRGAVLVRIRGRLAAGGRPEPADGAAEPASPKPRPDRTAETGPAPAAAAVQPSTPELEAASAEPPPTPVRTMLRMLRGDGRFHYGVLAGALAIAAVTVVIEAILLRGAMEVGRELGLFEQRLQAAGYLLVFVAALLLLELGLAGSVARLGRRLELRLRVAFSEKLPRLRDRYLSSRPISDMAERSHSIHNVRQLPRLGGHFFRAVFQIWVIVAGIVWLSPAVAPVAVLAGLAATGLPLLLRPVLEEQDLRVRTHTGALTRFYQDALQGLLTLRAHGAEMSVQREHEGLLVEWARAGRRRLRAVLTLEGLQSTTGFGFAFALLFLHAARDGDAGTALLLAYWALSLPMLGEELAYVLRQYPTYRNVALRLLEPLGAPENGASDGVQPDAGNDRSSARLGGAVRPGSRGAAVELVGLSVTAGGHPILREIDLRIEPGTHVALIGPSGAGKSTLLGTLLGWHRPAAGRLLVDGRPLDADALEQLRNATAWLDPAVQLWNRSLLDNLVYGSHGPSTLGIGGAVAAANLSPLLHRLPDGLQARLGEGGGLVSGGEGQRVRLARAMLRPAARLVLLDEPFRGLDREQRRVLLRRSRELWRRATLICVTHDMDSSLDFDAVVILEDGRLVETGAPRELARDPASRYRRLLDAEQETRERVWGAAAWRHLRLKGGRIVELTPRDAR